MISPPRLAQRPTWALIPRPDRDAQPYMVGGSRRTALYKEVGAGGSRYEVHRSPQYPTDKTLIRYKGAQQWREALPPSSLTRRCLDAVVSGLYRPSPSTPTRQCLLHRRHGQLLCQAHLWSAIFPPLSISSSCSRFVYPKCK